MLDEKNKKLPLAWHVVSALQHFYLVEHFIVVMLMGSEKVIIGNPEGEIIVGFVDRTKKQVAFDTTKKLKEETEKRSDEQNEIKVLLTGGEYANYKTVPFPECPLLDADKRYLLFLEKTEEGYYLPLGGYQGIATIDDSENVSFRDSECRTVFKNLENMKEKDIQNYVKKNIYE